MGGFLPGRLGGKLGAISGSGGGLWIGGGFLLGRVIAWPPGILPGREGGVSSGTAGARNAGGGILFGRLGS